MRVREAAMIDREKLARDKIKEDDHFDAVELIGIKQQVRDVLIGEKMFKAEELKVEPAFTVTLGAGQIVVSTDFLISFPSLSVMVIKCSSSSLESWERYLTAFARSVLDYQIPFAMVTDGVRAIIIDVLSGAIVGQSIHEMFTRQEAMDKLRDFKKIPFDNNKIEKERRIIYAFQGI
jgi:hypothetical protein